MFKEIQVAMIGHFIGNLIHILILVLFIRIREKKKLVVKAHREMKPRNNKAKLPRSRFLKASTSDLSIFSGYFYPLCYIPGKDPSP